MSGAIRRGQVESNMPPGRPRVLVFAYSAQPNRGSEPGGAWGVVMALAQVADVTVLVKSEHVPAIRKWEENATYAESSGVTFVEIRPLVPRFLQKLHRITEFLTYLMWLGTARRVGERMHLDAPFHLVHHVTYSAFWLPTPATGFGIPSVWGPVGGGVRAPRGLWGSLGIMGLFDELLDWGAVGAASRLPGTRRTWSQATVRVVQNEETRQALLPGLRESTHVLNSALLTTVNAPPVFDVEPVVVFPSALVSRKGPRIALAALAHAPGVRLQFAHGGPEEESLRKLADRLGVSDRVDFLGEIPRGELFERLSSASAALFAGVREEGGLALAEAMSLGTPVVVLSIGGAKRICEAAVDATRVALVDPGHWEDVAQGLGRAMRDFVEQPRFKRTPNLDLHDAEGRLRRILEEALGWPPKSLDVLARDRANLVAPPSPYTSKPNGPHPVAAATGGD
ncbi:MAG: glycosyltransferase [Longimicrobiales bacterium]